MGEHKNAKFSLHVVEKLSVEERIEHARRANEAMDAVRAAGGEPNAWLRDQFQCDLVYGVWQDEREPGGIGVALLKGKGRLMLVAQGNRPHTLSVSDIRCKEMAEAEAMCRVFGDGRAEAA